MLYARRRGQRKESFVRVCPLLHPPARILCDTVSRQFVGETIASQTVELVTEGNSVVVEAEHHADSLSRSISETINILIGFVSAMAPLPGNHVVTFFYVSCPAAVSECQRSAC